MKYLASCSHNKLCCSWVHHVCQKHHKCRTFFLFFLSLCVLLHQESSGIASPCVFSSSYVWNHYLRKIMSLIWIMALIWCIMLPLILFLANPPTCILHAWWAHPWIPCTDYWHKATKVSCFYQPIWKVTDWRKGGRDRYHHRYHLCK